MGYEVVGNLEGATVGKKTYKLGAITSVFLSKLLVDKLKIESAAPIPVGFDGVAAPKLSGSVAKQFPGFGKEELSLAEADHEVVKAYLTSERPKAVEGYVVPKYDVPAVSYADIIETQRRGRTRTDVLKYRDLPEKFYLRVAGSSDDLETMEAICQEDGIVSVVEEVDGKLYCYATNVDLIGFPPLPEHLTSVTFEKDLPVGSGKSAGTSRTVPVRAQPSSRTEASAPSAQTKDVVDIPLPDEWDVFMEVQDINSYNTVTASTAFMRSVNANKRAIGTNKYGWTKKVLNHWEVGTIKTVPEYVDILMSTAARNEAMAAKLMRALTTHLRAQGDCLKRVELSGQ